MAKRGKSSGAGEASVPPALSASKRETVDASVASLSGLNLDQLRLQWRNQLGGIAPAHLPGWLLMRVLAYRIQAAAFGDLDRTILAASERRRPRVGGRPSLCAPRADNARGRRAQVRSSAGPGVERPAGAGHGPRRWVRLERLRLPQPFAGRQGDHRHELERTPLLRAEGGEERRSQQKEERPNRHPAGEAEKTAGQLERERLFGLFVAAPHGRVLPRPDFLHKAGFYKLGGRLPGRTALHARRKRQAMIVALPRGAEQHKLHIGEFVGHVRPFALQRGPANPPRY